MPQTLRLLTKKRGGRTTGSDKIGGLWLAAFFAGMFFAGWGLLVAIVTIWALPEMNALRGFEETTCAVLAVSVEEKVQRGEPTFRPDITIRYYVNEREFTIKTYDINRPFSTDQAVVQAKADAFSAAESYPVYYDPDDPKTAVLVREVTPYFWLLAALSIPFITIGAIGLGSQLLVWRTSAERRAYLASQAAHLPRATQPGRKPADYPSVPKETNLTNSPGTHLAFRLPISVPRQWALAALWGGGLAWNLMVSVFVTLTVSSWIGGRVDWWLSSVTIAGVLVGIYLIWLCAKSMVRTVSLGRTLAEIDLHPLRPGKAYETHVAQFGRMTLRRLRILLVCDETATYEQGTNSRTETRRVFTQEIAAVRNIRVTPDEPMALDQPLTIPEEAMHSFRSAHNEIAWKLVVEGRPRGWLPFERAFPLVVYPRDPQWTA